MTIEDMLDEVEIQQIRFSEVKQDLDLIKDTAKKGAVRPLDIEDALRIFSWAFNAKTNLAKIGKLKEVIE